MEIRGFGKAFREITKSQKEILKNEVNSLAKEANHRIEELKKSGVYSAALNNWNDGGSRAFGITSGSYQDYQSEYWRIKNFLNAKTSTVNGAKQVLGQMVKITNMPIGVDVLTKAQASNYFKLASKIEDYYKMIGETAKALDYQLIWEQINVAIEHDYEILNEVNQDVYDISSLLLAIDDVNSDINASYSIGDDLQGIEKAANMPTKTGFLSKVAKGVKEFIGRIGGLFSKKK